MSSLCCPVHGKLVTFKPISKNIYSDMLFIDLTRELQFKEDSVRILKLVGKEYSRNILGCT